MEPPPICLWTISGISALQTGKATSFGARACRATITGPPLRQLKASAPGSGAFSDNDLLYAPHLPILQTDFDAVRMIRRFR